MLRVPAPLAPNASLGRAIFCFRIAEHTSLCCLTPLCSMTLDEKSKPTRPAVSIDAVAIPPTKATMKLTALVEHILVKVGCLYLAMRLLSECAGILLQLCIANFRSWLPFPLMLRAFMHDVAAGTCKGAHPLWQCALVPSAASCATEPGGRHECRRPAAVQAGQGSRYFTARQQCNAYHSLHPTRLCGSDCCLLVRSLWKGHALILCTGTHRSHWCSQSEHLGMLWCPDTPT